MNSAITTVTAGNARYFTEVRKKIKCLLPKWNVQKEMAGVGTEEEPTAIQNFLTNWKAV